MYQTPNKELLAINAIMAIESIENKIRIMRTNYRTIKAEYCRIHQLGHTIEQITYLPDIGEQIKKYEESYNDNEQSIIKSFIKLVEKAQRFNFYIEEKDEEQFIKTGRICL